MKAKGQEYYQKLVISGQWKKVSKILESGSQQEKDWILGTMGQAASRSDECYNQLVNVLQSTRDKATRLSAIGAMGACGRSAAVSQLEYLGLHDSDPQVQEALTAARHTLKTTVK